MDFLQHPFVCTSIGRVLSSYSWRLLWEETFNNILFTIFSVPNIQTSNRAKKITKVSVLKTFLSHG